MFETTVTALLEEKFVCEFSDPKNYHFLQNAENIEDIRQFVGRLGRTLKTTESDSAWYLGLKTIDDKNALRARFKKIKHEIAPIMVFMRTAMEAEGSDRVMTAGDHLQYDRLLNRIGESASLQEQLRGMAKFGREYESTDISTSARLIRVIDALVAQGYLHCTDKEARKYRVTGKIEYFHEVLQFIFDHEMAEEPIVIPPKNGELF
jgi:hypothetical protein